MLMFRRINSFSNQRLLFFCKKVCIGVQRTSQKLFSSEFSSFGLQGELQEFFREIMQAISPSHCKRISKPIFRAWSSLRLSDRLAPLEIE